MSYLRSLARGQADPRRKVTTRTEGLRRQRKRLNGGAIMGPIPGDAHQPSRALILLGPTGDLRIQPVDPVPQARKVSTKS